MNIPPNNVEIHFLLTEFFIQGCNLAAFLISKQPSRPSYSPGGLGLVGLCLWVFSLAPLHHHPHPRECWVRQVSWRVKKWHLRTYWFIIILRGVKLTTQAASGIAKGTTTFFILSAFFLVSTSSPFLKLLNHLVEGCMCYSVLCSPKFQCPLSELVFYF